jgi:hypothetical protein
MTITNIDINAERVVSKQGQISNSLNPRDIYYALLRDPENAENKAASRRYLRDCLTHASKLPHDLPKNYHDVSVWIDKHTTTVLNEYGEYLSSRHSGEPRRYFSNEAHALYFLKAVAPTKTVDGAWLYGVLSHWNDSRFEALIQIYLEELGSGQVDKNHVVLYKKLLASHGCENWDSLKQEDFIQGAIQVSLADNAEHFLPEIIGFNLGYEQLPLHLLITAYELNELGIDPYYFTLHVTVDNADTGHAKQALTALLNSMPIAGDADNFYNRVIDGYKLNELGTSTLSSINSFNLEQEVIALIAKKSVVGKYAHSDYCRIGGKHINEWLGEPSNAAGFLSALQQHGWIKRGEPVENSRFWNLLQGERAEMFGVFDNYELVVLKEWISAPNADTSKMSESKRSLSFKARQRLMDKLDKNPSPKSLETREIDSTANLRRSQRGRFSDSDNDADDFNQEARDLATHLASASNKEESMRTLMELMSPSRHHTPIGLQATRAFVQMMR